MRGLEGKRIVLTGTRKTVEVSALIEKWGGTPILRPLQGELHIEPSVTDPAIAEFIQKGADWIIFTTGIGVDMLQQAAARLGRANALCAQLRRTRIAARGSKTVKQLRELGFACTLRADEETTESLMRALQLQDLRQQHIAVQLYGEPLPALVAQLQNQGASVLELLPYQYLPTDPAVLHLLMDDLLEGHVEAVTFTSTAQVRTLFDAAKQRDLTEQVITAFTRVVAGAVGRVTAAALHNEGIARVVVPAEERVGSMIVALATYFRESPSRH